MAILIHNDLPHRDDFVNAINALKKQIGAGSSVHIDTGADYYSVTIALAACNSTPTAIALVNELRAASLLHRADILAHKAADAATITAPAATDLATANTLANELKSDYATHIASATIHYNADATNAITAPDATDSGTLVTLANDIRTQFLAHMLMAPTNVAPSMRLV